MSLTALPSVSLTPTSVEERFARAHGRFREEGRAFVLSALLVVPVLLALAALGIFFGVSRLGFPGFATRMAAAPAGASCLALGALLLPFVLRPCHWRSRRIRRYVAGTLVTFGLLAWVTLQSSLPRLFPGLYWPLFALSTFGLLAWIGQAYEPPDDVYLSWVGRGRAGALRDFDRADLALGFASGGPSTLLSLLRELHRSVGAWRGLGPEECQHATRILYALALKDESAVPRILEQLDAKQAARVVAGLVQMGLVLPLKAGPRLSVDGTRLLGLDLWSYPVQQSCA